MSDQGSANGNGADAFDQLLAQGGAPQEPAPPQPPQSPQQAYQQQPTTAMGYQQAPQRPPQQPVQPPPQQPPVQPPPVQQTPAQAPPAAPTQPEPPAEPQVVRDKFRARGLNLPDNVTDDMILDYVDELRQKNAQLTQYATQQWQQQQSQLQQPQEPQEPEQPSEPQAPTWKDQIPQYDHTWDKFTEYSEEAGAYVPRLHPNTQMPLASAEMVDARNKYERWRQEKAIKAVTDPVGLWQEAGGEAMVREAIEQAKKEILEQFETETEAVRRNDQWEVWHQQNMGMFVEQDPQTGQFVQNHDGSWKKSAFGEAYAQNLDMIPQQFGVDPNDQDSLYKLALTLTTMQMGGVQQPSQQQQVPQQQVQQQAQPGVQPMGDPRQAMVDRARQLGQEHQRLTQQSAQAAAQFAAQTPDAGVDPWEAAMAIAQQQQGLE